MRYFPLLFLAFATLPGLRDLSAQTPAPSSQTTLSPGDSVRIVVHRGPEYSGDFVIAPNGTITHPLFRDVRVGGVPLATAEANLRDALTKYVTNPQFVMEPLIRVAVSGEVPRPLVFAAQVESSIADAIARAGGTEQTGNRQHIRVIRSEPGGPQRVLFANLEDPLDRVARSPVRSGDQIIVDRKRSLLRDYILPGLGILGSVASLGLLIDRMSRNE